VPAKALRSKTLTALAVQNATLSLLPKVDKRIDDVQYANYNIPALKYGHRVLKMRDSTTMRGVGADAYVFTEADYVDGRVEKTFDVPVITLRTIDDEKQIKQLAKVNALLQKLVDGDALTTAQIKSALTPEQHKEYVYRLENPHDSSEIKYGDGMPTDLSNYNCWLKAADFQQAKCEKMSGMARSGRAKYKQDTVSRASNKAESLYEDALERLEQIWATASPAELYELQNWMDRDIDFDAGHDRTIGICVDSIPRVRGSKSSHSLDSGLPKLSKRLKLRECQLVALREAAWDIAFEREQDDDGQNEELSPLLKALLAKRMRDDD
jgi:hypothetical protein